MNPGKLLATLIIALDLAAGFGYAYSGDWKRAIYYWAASVLTWSVTY